MVSQLVDHKSLAVWLEGEAEIIMEEVVAILGVEVGSMGIYFLAGRRVKRQNSVLWTDVSPLNKCPNRGSVPFSQGTLLERMRVGGEKMTNSL